MGGDKLQYDGDTSSPAASILDSKLMINSVISEAKKGARFMGADLGDFFLGSKMLTPEYMRLPFNIFHAILSINTTLNNWSPQTDSFTLK